MVPHLLKTFITQQRITICVSFFIVTFFVLNCYISLVDVKYVVYPTGTKACKYPTNFLTTLRQLLFGQIPLLILIPSNALIVFKVIKQRESLKQNQKGLKRSVRLTIMILSISLSYTIFALPFSIFLLCCNGESENQRKIRDILSVFQMVNSSINFYLYFFSSKLFRNEVVNIVNQLAQNLGFTMIRPNAVEPHSTTKTDTTTAGGSVAKQSGSAM